MDEPAIGKHVRARLGGRRASTAWLTGIIKEIKRNGAGIVLQSGWNINLDYGDKLIWCSDLPCPKDHR